MMRAPAIVSVLALAVGVAGAAPQAAPGTSPAPPAASAAAGSGDWYPVPEPFAQGDLAVSALHTIHYELSGNPKGMPVMVLHGGPGGGSYPDLRRYHDPAKWLIVLHDQRGSGKSTPYGEVRENTTADLVGDVERLRVHLGLERVALFGGSWGSTLALAYAERYPERVTSIVLRGVFTGRRAEIDYYYHGGVEPFFPDVYGRLRSVIPHPERRDWPRQLYEMTMSTDAAIRDRAVRAWAFYEARIVAVGTTDEETESDLASWDLLSFSRLENYYMANGCFLAEGQLLRDAGRLAAIPMVIVEGRYDVICPPITAWELHRALPRSRLVMVEDAGHSGGAPSMRRALVEAVHSVERAARAEGQTGKAP